MEIDEKSKKNYTLINSSKKVFYFSKFSLEYEQCKKIVVFTKLLKENLLKAILEPLKYFVKSVEFSIKLGNREKIMCVFSIMFMFYYTKNSYEYNNCFEEFFTEDLANAFYVRGILIGSNHDFKVFSYTFYFELVKELSKMNYKDIKNNFTKYSNLPMQKSNSILHAVKEYVKLIKNIDIKKAFKSCLIPLIATKERIIDMVIDVTNSSSLANRVGSAASLFEGGDPIKSNNNSDIKSNETINSNETPKHDKHETLSKRIIGEVCQEQINEKELEFTNDIALKADTLVELILNHSNHKVYNVRNFLCYIVEINSDLIKLFPEYEDLPDDINLRVIIGARNLYLIALEVYYSVGDLFDTNLNTIMQVFKVRYPFSYNEEVDIPIRLFFKVLINNILEYNQCFNSEEILIKTLNLLNTEWEEEINKNNPLGTKGDLLLAFI